MANSEGEVRVIVTSEGSATTLTSSPPQIQSPNSSGGVVQTSNKSIARSMAFFSASVQIGSQLLNYQLANVGKYSGNSYRQTQYNNLFQGIGLGAMFMLNPYSALGLSAYSLLTTVREESFKRKQEQLNLEVERAKNGYTDTKSVLSSRRH